MGVYDDLFASMRLEIDRFNNPSMDLLTFAKWDKQWWDARAICTECNFGMRGMCDLHAQLRDLIDELRDKALGIDRADEPASD